jgi:pyruvate ferredoxin oxidoreductase gamma subunit
MLSVAAFSEGRHAQAFPTFGSERTGAPVVSFCRIDDRPIRLREPIAEPNALIVQDPTLLHQVNLFEGLRDDGYLLINTAKDLVDLGLGDVVARLQPDRLVSVPATDLAREHLGRPLPNAALLGGFAALTGEVSLPAVVAAIRARFPGRVGEGNAAAATAAFEHVQHHRAAPGGAPVDGGATGIRAAEERYADA